MAALPYSALIADLQEYYKESDDLDMGEPYLLPKWQGEKHGLSPKQEGILQTDTFLINMSLRQGGAERE